jgi:hypothetical protein
LPVVVEASFPSSDGGDGEVLLDGFSRELGSRWWGHRVAHLSLSRPEDLRQGLMRRKHYIGGAALAGTAVIFTVGRRSRL